MDNETSSSESDSSSSISDDSGYDTETKAALAYLDYTVFTTRTPKAGNKHIANEDTWKFVLSWDDNMFFRQFRVSKNNFCDLAFKMKNNFEGSSEDGWKNYHLSFL